MNIRNCLPSDIDQVRQFVSQCKPLGLHTAYTYWILFTYFSTTCFVMEETGQIIGFVSGVRSNEDIFFIWQLGVKHEYRSQGYSSLLLEKVVTAASSLGCKKIQFSIEPDNEKSLKASTSFARKHQLSIKRIDNVYYVDSLSGKQENEVLFEMSPA